MSDEPVFGPLNLKEFIYASFSFALIYFSYNFLPIKISIPVIIGAVIILISAFVNHRPVVVDEEYLKRKRYSYKNLDEFQKWLRRNIAMIKSQISTRRDQGMTLDVGLSKKLEMFESALRNIK